MLTPPRPTWVEVDLGAIRENLRRLKALAGVQAMAVVKANAYGHGAVAVARAAASAGAEWCGVAFSAEGLELARAEVRARVLVLGYTPPSLADEAIAAGLSLAVYDPDVAQAYASIARAQGRRANVHVKVDTGMGRLGVLPEDAVGLVRELSGLPGLSVEGVFTHFASADVSRAEALTLEQIRRFDAVIDGLTAAGLRPDVVHASNSPATIVRPRAKYDLVRLGIALYGLPPSDDVPVPDGIRPALSWKSVLASVREFPPGSGISYGHEYVTTGRERIGVVPVGYADGFRRVPPDSNRVIVRGRIVPVVGRVCMDQVMVRLDALPEARRDDEVVLIGEQGGAAITADDLARAWGTINYDVTSGIMARVPRVYRE